MPQLIRCPNATCGTAMKVPDDAVGKHVRCPKCQQAFLVGAPAREPAAAAVAAPAGAAARPSPPPIVAKTPTTPPPAPAPSPTECPACKAALLPGAIACMDCGYLLQADGTGDTEGAPTLCANPACGVANPPGERYCQRCSQPLPHPPGTMLNGRYRVERQIAVGGFGAVYLATDVKVGNRPVAVKDMICSDPQEFAIRLTFFRREAEILKSLDKLPIVPRVFDLIEQGQSALLALEYIRGTDLLKLMEAHGNKPFAVDQVVDWGKNICDVLTHMHGQTPPLVHRDLKPDNIMLLEDQRSIKLIDFGTARDLGRSQKERMQAKTRVYTEGYAPPEQIVGKPEPRSDLFALAGTMYHLASGKAPEGFYTARELESQLKDASSPIPSEHRWFYELLKINLAEDVNDRYFSAREIKADLEKRRVTREVACPKCKAVNNVREPYCAKCAEPLTDVTPPCHHCGKTNRMGSRCCIHCGNRLR
ncbi:MAG TPA: protein kinase [Gemmataceae bacterium]|nr:protein kinase [Gemmataceae bacterium]